MFRHVSRSIRSVRRLSSLAEYPIGSVHHGWKVVDSKHVEELDLLAVRMEHETIGSELLHLDNDGDANKAFSVAFRTVPSDSTGVAHILEHITLCGSSQYPVRDPFFKMLNRSLSTFMNAMTGLDYTFYPFSTQNHTDYSNLRSVYMSSVFHPLLRQQDFRQEGWRLENTDPADSNSPLIIKGVVFNEMKGVYADSQQGFMRFLLSAILPDHTYGHCSGGMPEDIPNLTYEGLKDFQRTHYSPANAKFYSYGDLNLNEHLKYLTDYLRDIPRGSSVAHVPPQKRWDTPRKETIYCAVDPSNPGSTSTVAYLTCDAKDTYEAFALNILSELLTDGPNAPFYKSLLETNLGNGFAPCTGYMSETKDNVFSIGIQGMEPENEDKFVQAVEDTFNQVAQEGFDPLRVEAILHSIELSMKKKSANFGINLIMSLTSFWNQTHDPMDALSLNNKIEKLRSNLNKNPKYFQDLLKKYYIDNSHKLTMTMHQKESFVEENDRKFEEIRNSLVKDLSDEEKSIIFKDGKELIQSQNTVEDLSSLPTLKVKEINDTSPSHECEEVMKNIFVCKQPTNGIAHFRSLISTKDLPPELRVYLPLFLSIATKLGAGQFDYRELDTEIDLCTGGLGISYHLSESSSDLNSFTEGIFLSSQCLERNTDRMFNLWSLVLNQIKYDPDRVKTLIQILSTGAINQVVHSGHSFAMGHSARQLSPAASLRESFGGLEHIKYLNRLSQNPEVDVLIEKFQEIANILFHKKYMKTCLHSTPVHSDSLLSSYNNFMDSLHGDDISSYPSKNFDQTVIESHPPTYVATPYPVNYAGKSIMTHVSMTHPDYAPLSVMARLATFKYLHTEIREKGGAYGGGARMSGDGLFTFYSYRDPNSDKTLETFNKTGEYILSSGIDTECVNESILGIFQKVDAPTTPGARGLRKFLSGITNEEFDNFRQSLKAVKVEDIKRVTDKYLMDSSLPSGVTIIGPESGSKDRKDWNIESLS
uniref:Presequence protease, mitochondrial n=1 Tax=Lepeophtheirus salmonis TaxID=72036 RepID=A0A0K2SWQ5_LEPSM